MPLTKGFYLHPANEKIHIDAVASRTPKQRNPTPMLPRNVRLFIAGLLVSCACHAQTAIKILGDSVSAGYGASTPSKRYTTLLANTLGVQEINPSISGATLTDKSYVDHMFDFWEATFLQGDPDDYALVFLGINDTQWITLHPAQAAVFAQRLETMVSGMIDYGYNPSRIILCAPYYFGIVESDYGRTAIWNAYNATSANHGVVFADFWGHASTQSFKSTYLKDGVHPDDAGHQLLHDWVIDALQSHIGPPFLLLTAPANGVLVLSGTPVTCTATATDDSAVVAVRFYVDDTLVATDTQSPYTCDWTTGALGTFTITAEAEDDEGLTTEDSATITVVAGLPPQVSLTSPADDIYIHPGDAVAVAADASDADGTVARVEFYSGTTLADTVYSAPYGSSLTWDELGDYTLFARVVDNDGNATDSAPVTVYVKPDPADGLVAAINCGSTTDFFADGVLFKADQFFTGGSTRNKQQEINLTDDDELFYTYRIATFSYAIPVEPGTYAITLYTCEPYYGSSGARVFNVDVEGARAYTDLDLYAAYGKLNATKLEITGIDVSDGYLNLAFAPDGMVNAIRVRREAAPVTGYAAWLAGHPGLADAAQDSDDDGDGISLLAEYAFGMDPMVPDWNRQLLAVSPGGGISVTFPRDPAKTDIVYIVETSDDLVRWTERFGIGDVATPNNAGTQHSVTVEAPTLTTFVRLRVAQAD